MSAETLENVVAEELAAESEVIDNSREITLSQRGQRVVAELLRGKMPEVQADESVSIDYCSAKTIDAIDVVIDEAGQSMLIPLKTAGITPSVLANALKQGLKAYKRVSIDGKVKRTPDYAIRIKYLELAHKLRNDYPNAQSDKADASMTYEQRLRVVMTRAQGNGKA